MTSRPAAILPLLAITVVALSLLSLGVGRYWVDPATVARIIAAALAGQPGDWPAAMQAVVLQIRPPRILAALLVGAALSGSGAAYQTMFRNPLVSPEILGVAAGAGFGAAGAILLGLPTLPLQILSFGCGLLAALLSLTIGRIVGRGSLIVLVLGGVVVGALFSALISGTEYFANAETTLPEIAFWLFGSLARATLPGLLLPTLVVLLCLAALYAVRWPLTVLAAGEDEARSLGVDHRRIWLVVVLASTLMTATVVSIAGIIGWVGLVVPHLARFLTGPAFSRLLPTSVLLGAAYVLAVDDVARVATSLDLPLGILTALLGAPFFVFLLVKTGRQWL